MPAYHCFYYTMAPGKIIEGGPGVKAQMTEMEQRHQYAEFIEISGKEICVETANKAELASIFKAFSFGASTEINFSDATQKYKEQHQENWSHVMTSEGYQFDVPQETVFFSYVKMILVRVRLISGVKTFTWPVGEVAKGPANKDDLLDLLNGKIRLDKSFETVLACFHIKPEHLHTRQTMAATLHIFYIRQDVRWKDYRWLTMELDKIVQSDKEGMTRNICLLKFSQFFRESGLEDKIALFSKYAQKNNLATIPKGVVSQLLYCNPDTH